MTEQIQCLDFSIIGAPVTVPEGSSATFTVGLDALPNYDVDDTVDRDSGDPDISVDAGSESFVLDATNWSTGVTVTLDAAEDADLDDGSAVIQVVGLPMAPALVTANEADNEIGFIVSTPNVNVSENGSADFEVKLSRATAGTIDVRIENTGGDTDITVQGSPPHLTFDDTDWDTWKTVTPLGGDDLDVSNGTVNASITAEGWTERHGAPPCRSVRLSAMIRKQCGCNRPVPSALLCHAVCHSQGGFTLSKTADLRVFLRSLARRF